MFEHIYRSACIVCTAQITSLIHDPSFIGFFIGSCMGLSCVFLSFKFLEEEK
jgi:hypothetical protein